MLTLSTGPAQALEDQAVDNRDTRERLRSTRYVRGPPESWGYDHLNGSVSAGGYGLGCMPRAKRQRRRSPPTKSSLATASRERIARGG